MSRENVEVIRGLWEPFKGVNLTAVDWDDEAIREMTERFWSPEVELRWSRNAPEARVYQGRDGVIQAFREWVEPFSEYYNEPPDFIEVGDRVVAPNRQSGIGIASGHATLGRIGFEGRFDYAAIGTVTILSSRLSAAAQPGQRAANSFRGTGRQQLCHADDQAHQRAPSQGQRARIVGDGFRRAHSCTSPAAVSTAAATSAHLVSS